MTEWNELCLPYDLQWFAKDGPGGEKTEEPTAKKLADARKDGKVAKSRELNHAFDLIVLFLLLKIFTSYIYGGFVNSFSLGINQGLLSTGCYSYGTGNAKKILKLFMYSLLFLYNRLHIFVLI